MDYFPAFLNLQGRQCLVVGGGNIALRKARLLAAAGANISVIAPVINTAFAEFIDANALRLTRRRFRPTDIDGNWLVVSATGDVDVESAVYAAASEAGVFCNGVDDKSTCSFITPAIVDRSPLLVAISTGGAAPVLARKLRTKIEMMLPSEYGRLADFADKWRNRVAKGIRSLRGRRRFWETVFDGPITDFTMGGNFDKAEQEMTRLLLDSSGASPQPGEVWLVGAGPGDPDLLTLRALQIMQVADVIVHDRLVSDEVLSLARRDADRVPVGKAPGCRLNSQEDINRLLVSLVASGKRVCRLKGGDPLIFGRGGEELEALHAAGFPCEVVPGITAAAGCAASTTIPLTHRDVSQSVVLATAHGKESVDRLDWPSLARDRQTLAFYMAVKNFPLVMRKLISHGRPAETPIVIVERGTLPDQRVVHGRLGQLVLLAESQRIMAPAMLFVGDVTALRKVRGKDPAGSRACDFATLPAKYAKQCV